jgi:MFS family permease
VLGLSLMVSQSFFYNAIFFSYALILSRFYGVPAGGAGLYVIPFAVGNFLGPLLLGRLFDTIGRRRMIAATYALSALLLLGTGYAFQQGLLTAATQTAAWCLVFFVASAAASSAYLTVSELFPVEIRGLAIALFFVVSQAAGAVATAAFGAIIQSHSRPALFAGYALGSALMLAAALVAAVLGVDAEGKSLEQLTGPRAVPEDGARGRWAGP